MNRYDILINGEVRFSYEAEAPMEHQPEWGTLAWTEALYDESGEPAGAIEHPQTYEVVVTDITYEKALSECHRQRAAAYPPIGDLGDAIVKGGEALEAYKAACLAVKARFPKPVKPS